MAVAVATAILIVVLERTRLGALGLAVAIVAASVVTALLPVLGIGMPPENQIHCASSSLSKPDSVHRDCDAAVTTA